MLDVCSCALEIHIKLVERGVEAVFIECNFLLGVASPVADLFEAYFLSEAVGFVGVVL